MSDTDLRKAAPRLLDRVDSMLAMYERRQTTNVPGTVSLIRDLAATLRAEMKGWASARGDAVDFSLRADELEAIVRDLADSAVEFDDSRVGWLSVQIDRPAWDRCREWVSAHPVSGDPA